MQNTANGNGIGQQSRDLTHTPLIIHGGELPTVQQSIPIREIGLGLIHSPGRIFEFGEKPTGHEIVVILVDFPQQIANLEV